MEAEIANTLKEIEELKEETRAIVAKIESVWLFYTVTIINFL